MKKVNISILSKIHPKDETKHKIKKMLPGIISTAVVLAVVLITVFKSTDGFTTIVETEPAKIVTERNHMSFTAYTLKNERLIKSNYSGGAYYLAEDAQRVNPGDDLAKVYEKSIDKNVVEALVEADKCISMLEESIGDGLFTLGESKEAVNKISSAYYDMMKSMANGNASTISALSDEFLVLLNKLKVYSGNSEEMKATLESYKSKKAELEKNYSGNYETVSADQGGYFFREADGYEGIYSSENIKNLTYESFSQMIDKVPSTEKCAGKLLVDFRWYLVVPTIKGISDTYSIGSVYSITFPDNNNKTFDMELDSIVFDESSSRSLMVFACGIIDKNFEYLRIQQISITHRNISGYRIPISALCEIGGNTGVYILKDGMASFRKAVVLYQGEDYYIVSAQSSNSDNYYIYLEPNDNIITDCKNMYEGKVIGG